MSLPPKKNALLHVARQELGMDEDEYRAMLLNVCGVASSRDLDNAGFDRLMKHLSSLGFRSRPAKPTFGDRPGMASPKQVEFMRSLWADYTDGRGDDITLGKWLNRQFGVAALRFCDTAVARKAISALKAMVRQPRNRERSVG